MNEQLRVEWDKLENRVILIVLREMNAEDMIGFWNLMMNKKDYLVSMTTNSDEVTIFFDESLLPFVEGKFVDHRYRETYVVYTGINTGPFVEQAGLVKQLSSVFSDKGIPIMYITTYNNDYVMVPIEFEEQADNLIYLPSLGDTY